MNRLKIIDNKPTIKPYSEKRVESLSKTSIGNLAASDLETMEIDGVQVPILITYVNKPYRDWKKEFYDWS